jgi:hypothetical protein
MVGVQRDNTTNDAKSAGGGTRMKRCDHCGGRFGLVTHRFFFKRFCRKRCKKNHLAALAEKFVSARRQWIAVVARSR